MPRFLLSVRLGDGAVGVLKGGGGKFERHPSKRIALYAWRAGMEPALTGAPRFDETRRLADAAPDPTDLPRLWSGELQDPFAQEIVIGTAGLALWTAGRYATN